MPTTRPVIDQAKDVLTEFCSALSGSAFCWWSLSVDRGGWVLHYAVGGKNCSVVFSEDLLEEESRWPIAARLLRAHVTGAEGPAGEAHRTVLLERVRGARDSVQAV